MKKSVLGILAAIALVGSLFASTETLAQTCNNRSNNTAYRTQQNYGYQQGYGYQQNQYGYQPNTYGYIQNNDSINCKQQSQHQRINQGLRTGQLTPQEAYQLRQRELFIRRQELIAKRDGRISYQERIQINRQLALLDKEIHQQKHDYETTYNTRNSRTYNARTYNARTYWPR